MAGLGGKNWTFQEEVTSSDVNGYLADQVVMRFADSTARTAGFGGSGEPTLAEGMVSYLNDANRVDYYNGSAWKPVSQVLQVVNTIKTDTFTATTGTGFTDVTGLTVTITPSATSSQIFIICTITSGLNTAGGFTLLRGSTVIGAGASAGNRRLVSTGYNQNPSAANQGFGSHSITVLDSPATTSAITYKIQATGDQAGSIVFVNRGFTDTDNSTHMRGASTITALEIAG